MSNIVGRTKEAKLLTKLVNSDKPEFLAVYGRRRIGKTYLLRQFFDNDFHFSLTGLANASTSQQLFNFDTSLNTQSSLDLSRPSTNWLGAFQKLIQHLDTWSSDKKQVVYIDELPWFDTKGSDFVMALEHFWNHWASTKSNFLLIVCGSAASWVVKNIINNKGGLHNRVTNKIKLQPFNLSEAEELLQANGCQLDRYQVIQLYMVLGGIPYYLDAIDPGLSAAQNIQALLFDETGLLHNEFYNLYRSLFKKHLIYEDLVTVLSSKTKGLTRKEITEQSKLGSGGTLTTVLRDLEESGFISSYVALDSKKKNTIYRLSDYYTAFFLRFIVNKKHLGSKAWLHLIDHPSVRAWEGFSFEQVCLDHVDQIKSGLGIEGMQSHNASWRGSTEAKQAQVDLLIDRRDQVINLCECKFSLDTYSISKDYADKLRSKSEVFRSGTKTKKSVFLTMITTYGLKRNQYSDMLVTSHIDMDVLFT